MIGDLDPARIGASLGGKIDRLDRPALKIGYFNDRSFGKCENPAEIRPAMRELLAFLREQLIVSIARVDLQAINARIRHRVAIRVLTPWYQADVDAARQLPLLATYLGHVCVADTYRYLSSWPELMAQAMARLERRWGESP